MRILLPALALAALLTGPAADYDLPKEVLLMTGGVVSDAVVVNV